MATPPTFVYYEVYGVLCF